MNAGLTTPHERRPLARSDNPVGRDWWLKS
jgi:hypothetical protein